MTYHPEYEIGEKSPGVWKEVRRLETHIDGLRTSRKLAIELLMDDQATAAIQALEWEPK